MDCITLSTHLQALEPIEEVEALSLYRAFEQMSDHRQKRGVRYPLAIVLSLLVLGKLAGMTSFAGIAEWVRWRANWLKEVLPLTRASLPCASTYGNVLRTIEAEEMTRMRGSVADALGGYPSLWRRTQSVADPARSARAACPGGPRRENPAGDSCARSRGSAQLASGGPL